jgi:hypothetical protein
MSLTQVDRSAQRGKMLVFTLAVGGSILGALPTVLLLAPVWWLACFAGIAVVVAIFAVRGLKRTGPTLPSAGEAALAAVAGIGPMASMSLAIIGWYWGVYGLMRLATALANALEWRWMPSPAAVAHVIIVVMAAPLGPMVVWTTARGLWRHLFPPAAGVQTPYYRLMVRNTIPLVLGVAAALVGVIVLFVVIGPHVRLFYLWLAIYLAFPSSALWQVGEQGSRSRDPRTIETAIVKLLEALGFGVVSQPRTGRPEVDPFLLKADFLAQQSGRALLIAVKVRLGEEHAVEWTEASALMAATWALDQAKESLDLAVSRVEPVLLLVGKGPAESLQAFAEKEPIRLIHVRDPGHLTRALETASPIQLGILAQATLGPLTQDLATVAVPLSTNEGPLSSPSY